MSLIHQFTVIGFPPRALERPPILQVAPEEMPLLREDDLMSHRSQATRRWTGTFAVVRWTDVEQKDANVSLRAYRGPLFLDQPGRPRTTVQPVHQGCLRCPKFSDT